MKQISPETLPAWLYRDREVYETERRNIFGRAWLLIAHESQLPNPGEYVAASVAGYPLIAVRGAAGDVRAFHNVCRHRAGPLAEDGQGRCDGQLVCRYHGWRYALDGRLANARDFGAAEGFDPRDYALKSVACETWRGFVFVNMDKDAQPLAKFLAPLDARTRHLPLETFTFKRGMTHDIACNWKAYVENYLEGYHIPLVHPFLNAAVDASKYEVDLSAPIVFHQAPPRDGSLVDGLWAWAWPCLGLNVYADAILMERMWPLSATHTRLDYLCLFKEGVEPAVMERNIAACEITTGEDKKICEAVQRNLDAGIYETGRLSPKHEIGVSWFQGEVRRALNL
ncbi:MAG TPA: aromatic ring-hydroxylating dioxygenase subunit alpha [Rhizomicrobium sp.]|jgi:choline monooxygenase